MTLKNLGKRLLSRLSSRQQLELRRIHYGRHISRGTFGADEPEYHKLAGWIRSGDCVLDIGANVGHYTIRLAQLVGPNGRVIALEPVPETFALLAWNVARSGLRNVTLLNLAVSDETELCGMTVPTGVSGLPNYYMASLRNGADTFGVCSIPIDALGIDWPVRLVKIDTEGHEPSAIRGMRNLIEQSHPVLIVEGRDSEVVEFLAAAGYSADRLAASPNVVYSWLRSNRY